MNGDEKQTSETHERWHKCLQDAFRFVGWKITWEHKEKRFQIQPPLPEYPALYLPFGRINEQSESKPFTYELSLPQPLPEAFPELPEAQARALEVVFAADRQSLSGKLFTRPNNPLEWALNLLHLQTLMPETVPAFVEAWTAPILDALLADRKAKILRNTKSKDKISVIQKQSESQSDSASILHELWHLWEADSLSLLDQREMLSLWANSQYRDARASEHSCWMDAALTLFPASEQDGSICILGPRADQWAKRAVALGIQVDWIGLSGKDEQLRASLSLTDMEFASRPIVRDFSPEKNASQTSWLIDSITEVRTAIQACHVAAAARFLPLWVTYAEKDLPDPWTERMAAIQSGTLTPNLPEYTDPRCLEGLVAAEGLSEKGKLLWRTPKLWWAGPGYGRWRQKIQQLFAIQMVIDEPPTPDVLPAVLVLLERRTAKASRPEVVLVRLQKALAELLPTDGMGRALQRRKDRLNGLWQTVHDSEATETALYTYTRCEVESRSTPSIRVRKVKGGCDAQVLMQLLCVPESYLALVSCRPKIWGSCHENHWLIGNGKPAWETDQLQPTGDPAKGLWSTAQGMRISIEVEQVIPIVDTPHAQSPARWSSEELGYTGWMRPKTEDQARPQITFVLGEQWPNENTLQCIENGGETQRTARRLQLMAFYSKAAPWVWTSLFPWLARFFQDESLPWEAHMQLPVPEEWPEQVLKLVEKRLNEKSLLEDKALQKALDLAVLEALGVVEPEYWLKSMQDNEFQREQQREQQNFRKSEVQLPELDIPEMRSLFPDRRFPNTYYQATGPRQPADYASLRLQKFNYSGGELEVQFFMGEYRLLDRKETEIWRGNDRWSAAFLLIQSCISETWTLTLPHDPNVLHALLTAYVRSCGAARQKLIEAAFRRTRNLTISEYWADAQLREAHFPIPSVILPVGP